MKSESILNILESLYSKQSDFTEEELDKIDSLTIKRQDYDKEVLSVDFNDLLYFKNLKNLVIDGCMLDLNVILILKKITFLESLSLYNCEIIEDIYQEFNNINIKELLLYNVDFDLSKLNKNYEYLKLALIDFKPFASFVDYLDVSSCQINDIDLLFQCNFNEIVVSFELYATNQLRFDDSNKKVVVMNENGQFEMKRVGFNGKI